MRISLIKINKIENHVLPNEVYGNYWIEDRDINNNKRNLINVEAENGLWKIKSNFETQILINGQYKEHIYLKEYEMCVLTVKGEENSILFYASPTFDNSFTRLLVPNQTELLIGKDEGHLTYNFPFIDKSQVKLAYFNNEWVIENINTYYNIYVNNYKIIKTKLKNGDIIFIMGLKIVIMGNTILVNNPNNLMKYRQDALSVVLAEKKYNPNTLDADDDVELFSKKDYFYKAPRFKNILEKVKIEIESPPQEQAKDDMPMIYTIGPMLTMGMTSVIMMYSTLSNINSGQQTFSSAMPSLLMSGSMLLSMLLWPLLRTNYQKRKVKKNNKNRLKKYRVYLEEKKKEIELAIAAQRNNLNESLLTIDECASVISEKKHNLWERKIEHNDFLNLRLGLGNQEPNIEISYPKKKFTLEEDKLVDEMNIAVDAFKQMEDVPFANNFTKEYISAIIGQSDIAKKFIEGLILQMITFHDYNDLKIIILTNSDNDSYWSYLKTSNYNWNNQKSFRYYATNIDEANQVDKTLEEIFIERTENPENKEKDYKQFSTYYMIISDDFNSYRNLQIIKNISNSEKNYGFSMIINNERLIGIPPQCTCFINVNNKIKSSIYGNELNANSQHEFKAEIPENLNIDYYCKMTSNIPIETENGSFVLPDAISFLKMYEVGKVEQLNSLNRWKNNNPVLNLQAPVGIGESGELFKLDLHEKFHGPHGLIAGMTGSGKSEFIITYVLSMAVNYHPDEVQFVLIDYKGGGLVGAFENKETGVSLPHLAGTITNLDTSEMNRALSSIQSELKRRQRIFNKAREALNEGTIDIYKYQRFYRAGKVKEPVSHLFIISDEFAELKSQQPEFMDQLISTARIGRSLGVHLILATQKPSGVVNEQIWSNSRFRVCLKVQEKADSNDMIKRPDAAALKNVGRFYLQVGYNELFALGQSAWCGEAYYATEKLKKKIDTNLSFVDNTGYVIKTIDNKIQEVLEKKGEELTNIVNYLYNLGRQQNITIPKLWLNKISEYIFVDNLKQKYFYKKDNFILNPVIGEYDNPSNQSQHLLTLPLSKEGNTIIYGIAGSGKENLLSTIVYSIITTYSIDEVNLYLMDFGAGTLKNFEHAPQIGDVILQDDSDKIEGLFKLINKEIENRKKLIVDYNGSYYDYCLKSGKTLPTIVIVMNNYDAFNELYSGYADLLNQLTRECLKYGIVFVVSTTNSNALSFRIKQNFAQQLALQLADSSDYMNTLGVFTKMTPSKIKGRGLINLDGIYEFQSAYATMPEKLVEYIKFACDKLNNSITSRASKIKILPKIITIDYFKNELGDIEKLPVGMDKDSLKTVNYNFFEDFLNIVTTADEACIKPFIKNLINEFILLGMNVYVFDGAQIFKDEKFKYECFQTFNSGVYTVLNSNNSICFVTGVNKIFAPSDLNINEMLGHLKTKTHIIFCDDVENIKKCEFDPWFGQYINKSSGIWLGSGIESQYLIKLNKTPKNAYDGVPNDFGYIIKSGKTIYAKMLGEEKNE